MAHTDTKRRDSYDKAAPRWSDKMRLLGYYDSYLGFLSDPQFRSSADRDLIDIGCGTAAFSEAWTAIHGPPKSLTLLDPSQSMLSTAANAIASRGVIPTCIQGVLGDDVGGQFDEVLAAHVIEHCPDPAHALKHMHDVLRPGGTLRLIVSKPHWCNAIIWLQWRHRTFSQSEISACVADAGFSSPSFYAFPSGPPSRTSMGLIAQRLD